MAKDVKMKKMTITQLVDAMVEKTGLDKKTTKSFIEQFSELALSAAKKGGFIFPNIGILVLVDRKARMGRNPATGEQIKIKAKKVLKFKISKKAKDAVLGVKK